MHASALGLYLQQWPVAVTGQLAFILACFYLSFNNYFFPKKTHAVFLSSTNDLPLFRAVLASAVTVVSCTSGDWTPHCGAGTHPAPTTSLGISTVNAIGARRDPS